MGSPCVLDLDSLVLPISEENPAGEDLREDLDPSPVYYQIKDTRSTARAAERQGEFEPVIGALEAAAWRPILGLATDVLTTRAKDLEICAWLIEALVRTDGFAGLRDGLRLTRELVENYWDGLYPLPDEDGLETKVAPLAGLNGAGMQGTLTAPLARIPITQGSSTDPLATWSLQQAQELERLDDDARQERIEGGARTLSDAQAAVRETPPGFFVDLLDDIEESQQELAALGAALDELCGTESPPTSSIRESLTAVSDAVRQIAGHVLPEDSTESEGADTGDPDSEGCGSDAASEAGNRDGVPGAINSRENAFKALHRVAEYFRSHEPHSPISFLVERAVRWGRLPLPQLLSELIPDESARDTYAQLTGVENASTDEYDE